MNLYADSSANVKINDQEIIIKQKTDYPWDGNVNIAISTDIDLEFALALRIPGWCRDAEVKVNREDIELFACRLNLYFERDLHAACDIILGI